jgi:hypothetical protein
VSAALVCCFAVVELMYRPISFCFCQAALSFSVVPVCAYGCSASSSHILLPFLLAFVVVLLSPSPQYRSEFVDNQSDWMIEQNRTANTAVVGDDTSAHRRLAFSRIVSLGSSCV